MKKKPPGELDAKAVQELIRDGYVSPDGQNLTDSSKLYMLQLEQLKWASREVASGSGETRRKQKHANNANVKEKYMKTTIQVGDTIRVTHPYDQYERTGTVEAIHHTAERDDVVVRLVSMGKCIILGIKPGTKKRE